MGERPRRFVGYSLLAAGALATLVGASPIFPVYAEAFVAGGFLAGAGLWVLAGPELRALIGRAASLKLRGRGKNRSPAAIDPLLPVRILKLARENHGLLTVAEVAMGLNIPIDEAEAGLSECVRTGNAAPDFDVLRARAQYRFAEFLDGTPTRGN
jgi:hypothetical protein